MPTANITDCRSTLLGRSVDDMTHTSSLVHVFLCAYFLSCSLGLVAADEGVLPFLSLSGSAVVNLTANNTVEDGYSPVIALPSSLHLGSGTTASTAHVNTNGFVSFNGELPGGALPSALTSLRSTETVLAPYWDDISLSSTKGYILYELNTDPASSIAGQVNNFIASSSQTLEGFNTSWLLVVQWIDVCPFNFRGPSACQNSNTFQAVIATNGLMTVGIFSYQCGSINWKRRPVIGYHVSSSYIAQHPWSMSDAVTDIDCVNEPQSQWTNLVYYMNEVSPTAQLLSKNEAIHVYLSSSINITCRAQGNPIPSVVWIRNGQPLPAASAVTEYTALSDITAVSILFLSDIRSTDYGRYFCQAVSDAGSDTSSSSMTLYRTSPIRNRFRSDHKLTEVQLGGNVYSERCKMDGQPQPTVKWIGPHGPVVNDSHISIVESVSYSGSGRIIVESTLTLIGATYDYNGTYVCAGSNVINLNGDISAVNYTVSITVLGPPAFKILSLSVATVSESFQLMVKVYPVISPHLLNWSFTNGNNTRLQNISCNSSTCSFSNDRLTLTLYNVTLSDQGEYLITATNSYGTRSALIPLQVQAPVSITDSPDNVTVAEGSDISVTCQSHGLPLPTITWYRNGQILTAAEGESIQITHTVHQYSTGLFLTVSTLNITGISPQDKGVYTCMATNNISTVPSHFTVTVHLYPNITVFPVDVLINTTDSLELYCTAQSVVSLTWYYDGKLLQNLAGVLVISQSVPDPSVVKLPVATMSVLRLINISKDWEGTFSCRALDNNTGLEMTELSSVIVQVPPSISGPTNITAILFSPFSLSVSLANNNATPPVTTNDINWSFTNVTNNSTTSRLLYGSSRHRFSVDLLTLHISAIEWTDEGVYQVTVQTSAGSDTNAITMTVESPPVVASQTVDVEVVVNGNATLPCTVVSRPLHAIHWLSNDHSTLSTGNRYLIQTNTTSELYGTLYITNATVNDSGLYTCIATNKHGTANITVILTVLIPPRLIYHETVTPLAFVDHSYTLSVNISRASFPLANSTSVLWERVNSTSAVPLRAVTIYNRLARIIQLTFTNISIADAGQYRLSVWTRAGTDSIVANLDVQAVPVIHTPSVVRTLRQGDALVMTCLADGIPQPVISWFVNGRPIGALSSTFSISDTVLVMGSGYRNGVPLYRSVLNATGLLPTNNGSYSCKAKNKWGETLAQQIQLFVAPEFINYCASTTCFNGATCYNEKSSFLCHCASGWTGLYCDQMATFPSPPQFTEFQSVFYQEYETPLTISCPVVGYPQPTVTWYRNNVLIPGANTQTYVITSLTLDTRGLYHCIAVNSEGTSVSKNIYAKIRGLVQYRAVLNFTEEFIRAIIENRVSREADSETFRATRGHLNNLMNIINREMISKLSQIESLEYRFFSVELVSYSISSLLDPIPVILTIASNVGGGAVLKTLVEDAFDRMKSVLNELSELADPVFVEQIERFDGCRPERTVIPSPNGDPNLDFVFDWPEIDISQSVTFRCPCGPEGFDIGVLRNISRVCLGDFTNGASWVIGDESPCNFSTTARELCQLAFLSKEDEVLNGLDNITVMTDRIGSLELSISTVFVENLTISVSGDANFTDTYLDVVDNLVIVDREAFIESNEEARTSGRLLQSFEEVVNQYPSKLNTTVLLRTKFVVTVRDFDEIFENSSFSTGDDLVFSINGNLSDNFTGISAGISFSEIDQPVASIVIPAALVNNILQNTSNFRLVQSVFDTDALFLRRESLLSEPPNSYLRVGSLLASASFLDQSIVDSEELINITLRKDETLKNIATSSYCSFWNQSADDYYGNWSQYGCQLLADTLNEVVCGCDHLTTFALLMDVAPDEKPPPPGYEELLMSLSYLGCAVSSVCLAIIILTYTIEKQLRITKNGQLLLNMSTALLGLYIIYIPALYAAPVEPLCIMLSSVLHYFFLACFLAMASEATILYFELVLVLTSKGKGSMIVKAVVVTWVLPAFIVGFALAPNLKGFKSDQFCRPVEWQYWIGFIAPFCIIYIYNWAMFFIIVVSLCKQQRKSGKGNDNLKTSTTKQFIMMITLSVLFGLGWGIGLAATQSFPVQWLRYTLQIIFVNVVGFQGLFLFIFHGIRVPKVREVWLKWFYIVTNQIDKAVHVDSTLRNTNSSTRNKNQSSQNLEKLKNANVHQLKDKQISSTSWSSNCNLPHKTVITFDKPQLSSIQDSKLENDQAVTDSKLLDTKVSCNDLRQCTTQNAENGVCSNGRIVDSNVLSDNGSNEYNQKNVHTSILEEREHNQTVVNIVKRNVTVSVPESV